MNDKSIENFLYNVAYLRRHYSISKKKMAAFLGVSIKTLNKMESGVLPPRMRIDIMIKIYKHFHITPANQVSSRLGE